MVMGKDARKILLLIIPAGTSDSIRDARCMPRQVTPSGEQRFTQGIKG